MAKQLLIYEQAVAITPGRHKDVSVEVGDYKFSSKVNSVPLMAIEFLLAASEYPIVFAGDEAPMPAVILGMRGNENVFVGDEGKWEGKYIPAFVRRYPFVFSANTEGTTFTLCIDESFGGLNKEGRGKRLFDDEGKPTEFTSNVLKFLQEYQAQFRRTQAFCKRLKDLGILEPMQAQVTLANGSQMSLSGFTAVNRDKLKALSGDVLSELAKNDSLELIYLHLQSLRNFGNVRERIHVSVAAPTAEAPATVQ